GSTRWGLWHRWRGEGGPWSRSERPPSKPSSAARKEVRAVESIPGRIEAAAAKRLRESTLAREEGEDDANRIGQIQSTVVGGIGSFAAARGLTTLEQELQERD